MYVCGIYVLKIVVEWWFWGVLMLIGSLAELHAWLHSHLCFSPFEKLFLTISTTSRHLSIPGLSVELYNCFLLQSRHLSITRWINWESSCLLDSFSIAVRSIEVCSIASWHFSIDWNFLTCIVFHMFCIFLLSCHP